MKSEHKDILEQATEALINTSVPQGPPQSLMQQTLEQIKTQQQKNSQTLRAWERIKIMKSLPKLAAAAVIIIGVWVGLTVISPDQGIILADVLHRVQAVPVFTYRIQMTTSGQPLAEGAPSPQNMSGNIWISNQTNAVKMEMFMDDKHMQTMVMLPEENRMITLMPEAKKYMEFTLSEDMLDEYRQNQADPREMIGRFIDTGYTDLGSAVVNGIKCRVIESTDIRLMGGMFDQVQAKLWIDAETGYPVQWEMNITTNEGKTEMHILVYDFQWDAVVDPGQFEVLIPEGYTSMGTIQIPKMDETAALDGFRKFVELTGEYPKTLSPMEIMQDLMQSIQQNHPEEWKEQAKKMESGTQEEQQQFFQKLMDEVMPIQALGMFYAKLIQENKNPGYYGDRVTPGQSGAVLLRWQVEGDTYKVIYGDLTTTEMSLEELQQIEPAPDPETP